MNDKLMGRLRASRVNTSRSEPLWAGPGGAGKQGGVTFSLLSRYLTCKERFRLYAVEGLRGADRFNHRMEYGNMWHACEEALAGQHFKGATTESTDLHKPWHQALVQYSKDLVKKYPMQAEEIDKWYNVCKVQFPLYVDHWRKHPDVTGRKPVMQEEVFDVPYKLPSGRTVRLRGKQDSVDKVAKGPNKGGWIQENKTKGDIDQGALTRQLTFDLQSMLYVVMFTTWQSQDDYGTPVRFPEAVDLPIRGVRYNVVRRPLSGGEDNIKQLKPTKKNPQGETRAEYYQRLGDRIKDNVNPDGTSNYFMRWLVPVTAEDQTRFVQTCLDPILENLCDDYEWWLHCHIQNQLADVCTTVDPKMIYTTVYDAATRRQYYPHHCPRHHRHPFGVRNVLDEGGAADLDEHLRTGSEVGLVRVTNLFQELQP